MYRSQLFVVSGPSGVGKGTICKMLLEEGFKAVLSISMTTRAARPGETDGENYYFISREEFENIIKSGGFLEYAEVYGNYYGTPKQKVLSALEKGIDVILEIDVQGALKIKNQYPEVVLIFILPPSMAELKNRIQGRGAETEAGINQRMNEVMKEASYIDKYDYYIINEELTDSVSRLKSIIAAEKSRVSQIAYEFIEKYKEEI